MFEITILPYKSHMGKSNKTIKSLFKTVWSTVIDLNINIVSRINCFESKTAALQSTSVKMFGSLICRVFIETVNVKHLVSTSSNYIKEDCRISFIMILVCSN